MKKYLVEVFLPASGKRYDVYLPAKKKIEEATYLLAGIVESLSGGDYKGTSNTVLLDAGNGEPFNRNDTVYDAGIRNASKLILI